MFTFATTFNRALQNQWMSLVLPENMQVNPAPRIVELKLGGASYRSSTLLAKMDESIPSHWVTALKNNDRSRNAKRLEPSERVDNDTIHWLATRNSEWKPLIHWHRHQFGIYRLIRTYIDARSKQSSRTGGELRDVNTADYLQTWRKAEQRAQYSVVDYATWRNGYEDQLDCNAQVGRVFRSTCNHFSDLGKRGTPFLLDGTPAISQEENKTYCDGTVQLPDLNVGDGPLPKNEVKSLATILCRVGFDKRYQPESYTHEENGPGNVPWGEGTKATKFFDGSVFVNPTEPFRCEDQDGKWIDSHVFRTRTMFFPGRASLAPVAELAGEEGASSQTEPILLHLDTQWHHPPDQASASHKSSSSQGEGYFAAYITKPGVHHNLCPRRHPACPDAGSVNASSTNADSVDDDCIYRDDTLPAAVERATRLLMGRATYREIDYTKYRKDIPIHRVAAPNRLRTLLTVPQFDRSGRP